MSDENWRPYEEAARKAFEAHHDKRFAMPTGDFARYVKAVEEENPGLSETSQLRLLTKFFEQLLRFEDQLVHEVRFRLEGIEAALGLRYGVTPDGRLAGEEYFPRTKDADQPGYHLAMADGTLREIHPLLERVLGIEQHLGISPLKD